MTYNSNINKSIITFEDNIQEIELRKIYITEESNKAPVEEKCPKCSTLNLENKLRYMFVNLEEAVYKCEGLTCMFPFRNFKFKNFKNNTVYRYKTIGTEKNDNNLTTNDHKQEIMCSNKNEKIVPNQDLIDLGKTLDKLVDQEKIVSQREQEHAIDNPIIDFDSIFNSSIDEEMLDTKLEFDFDTLLEKKISQCYPSKVDNDDFLNDLFNEPSNLFATPKSRTRSSSETSIGSNTCSSLLTLQNSIKLLNSPECKEILDYSPQVKIESCKKLRKCISYIEQKSPTKTVKEFSNVPNGKKSNKTSRDEKKVFSEKAIKAKFLQETKLGNFSPMSFIKSIISPSELIPKSSLGMARRYQQQSPYFQTKSSLSECKSEPKLLISTTTEIEMESKALKTREKIELINTITKGNHKMNLRNHRKQIKKGNKNN